jgi:predicted nucleotidyltransferase
MGKSIETVETPERKPKDRDFVRTLEGMFFCVTGYLHPPDRYTAYLKYSPVDEGKWRDAETAYRREIPYYHVRNVEATLGYLEAHYPHYVHYCPVRDIRFSMVPHRYVAHYYIPEERLQEILFDPQDGLEEEVRDLVGYLEEAAAIPGEVLGVTGSILTGFHNPSFSDIDLLIYGAANGFSLRRQIREGRLPLFRRPDRAQVEAWCDRVMERFHLSAGEAMALARRRWNYGFFGQRYVSIHATREDSEISEVYGDRIYRNQGPAEIEAVITDDQEALFMPAVYHVRHVRTLSGSVAARQVSEIVSYEGLYCDMATAGQAVRAYGKLESINGDSYRLVVGTTTIRGGGHMQVIG